MSEDIQNYPCQPDGATHANHPDLEKINKVHVPCVNVHAEVIHEQWNPDTDDKFDIETDDNKTNGKTVVPLGVGITTGEGIRKALTEWFYLDMLVEHDVTKIQDTDGKWKLLIKPTS